MARRIGLRWTVTALSVVALALGMAGPVAFGEQGSLVVGGRTRTYSLHAPSGVNSAVPAPLVLVFHGGGGSGAQMERLTSFDAVADREKFIVVYPDGFANNWNDGRESNVSRSHGAHIDDEGFISALTDAVSARYAIDAKRIYATGILNGGIFSHYLAPISPTELPPSDRSPEAPRQTSLHSSIRPSRYCF